MDCSFVIPAYNEESFLPHTIKELKSAITRSGVFKDWEIIVVDNNSNDRTVEVGLELGAIVVHEPIRQIARARNTGAARARGEMIIFLDADTAVEPETLRQAREALFSGQAYGGGALIKFDHHQNRFFLGMVIPAFWNWISKTFRFAAGSFIFCTKKDFISTGGFPQTMYAGEELGFIRRLKKINRKSKGRFLILTNPPVVTSSRKLSWHSKWQMSFYLLLLIIFPFSVRFRKLCGFWYERPQS